MAFLQEYTMLDELGKGGYATVYKVRHNELGYIRAIRVLNETIVDSTSKTYEKFLRECKVLLRLGNGNHPNIVHIYQPRLLENNALVEMDYVDGMDIQHYLKQSDNFVLAEEVIRMAMQISSALAYCHEDICRFCMDRDTDNLQDDPNDGTKVLIDDATRKRLIDKYKVIHNDIHSGNIMRREDGNFVLLDFGLAIYGNEVVRSSRRTNGAPEFKAPEKWNNDYALAEQSDIYSFGVVLYHYISGRVPFQYDSAKVAHIAEYELAEAHQKTPPPSIESFRKERYEQKFEGEHYERDYPQWLEDVIMRCLSKNPAERFRNGRELYECITAHSQEHNGIGNDMEIDKLTKEKDELADEVDELRNTNHYLAERLQAATRRPPLPNRTKVILTVLLILSGIWGIGASGYIYWSTTHGGSDNLTTQKDRRIADLEEYVSTLKGENGQKDKRIRELEKKSKQPNQAEIKQLNDEIAQKNERIGNLEANLQKSQADYAVKIEAKDNTISNLETKIKQLSGNATELTELRSELEQKDKRINDLLIQQKQQSSDYATEIDRLKKEITKRDNKISELQKKANMQPNDNPAEITRLNNEITTLKTKIGLLQTEVEKRDKIIENWATAQ